MLRTFVAVPLAEKELVTMTDQFANGSVRFVVDST
jgi:hypothetical protein